MNKTCNIHAYFKNYNKSQEVECKLYFFKNRETQEQKENFPSIIRLLKNRI